MESSSGRGIRKYEYDTAYSGFAAALKNIPGAGAAAGFFATVALPLLESPLHDRTVLKALADALLKTRPLPGTKWAAKIGSGDYDRNELILALRQCLESKSALPEGLANSADSLIAELNIAEGDSLVIKRTSDSVAMLVRAIVKRKPITVDILSERVESRAEFEARIAWEEYGKIPGVAIRQVRAEDVFGHSDVFRGRCKAVVLGCHLAARAAPADESLTVVVARHAERLLRSAREDLVPSVLVLGTYKFWDQPTFQSQQDVIFKNRDVEIVDADLFDYIVTEDGVFTNAQALSRYKPLLDAPEIPGGDTAPSKAALALLRELAVSRASARRELGTDAERLVSELVDAGYVRASSSYVSPTAVGLAALRSAASGAA
jgi:hypothetical protein